MTEWLRATVGWIAATASVAQSPPVPQWQIAAGDPNPTKDQMRLLMQSLLADSDSGGPPCDKPGPPAVVSDRLPDPAAGCRT